MMAWQEFSKCKPTDGQFEAERGKFLESGSKDSQNRHNVLPIPIDVTNTIAQLQLPIRRNDEKESSVNRGVFLEIVELLSR